MKYSIWNTLSLHKPAQNKVEDRRPRKIIFSAQGHGDVILTAHLLKNVLNYGWAVAFANLKQQEVT